MVNRRSNNEINKNQKIFCVYKNKNFKHINKGEKLTLDITILLSLVFYLQIISDYIPRSFSKIPILTLFTLVNFFLVFLSCVFTVLVLRLYYKTPTFFSSRNSQLPYVFRLILFKYIAPVLLLKFNLRNRDEVYLTHGDEYIKHQELKQVAKSREHLTIIQNKNQSSLTALSSAELTGANKRNANNIYLDTYAINLAKIRSETDRKLQKNFQKSTPIDLLKTLKLLNKCILINNKLNSLDQMDDLEKPSDTNINLNLKSKKEELLHMERSMYYEEWKQASLVLDRLFFFVFLICMPLTTLVFFRTDVFEYMNSSGQNNSGISNINC